MEAARTIPAQVGLTLEQMLERFADELIAYHEHATGLTLPDDRFGDARATDAHKLELISRRLEVYVRRHGRVEA